MSIFNNEEKSIIEEIISGQGFSRSLGNIFYKYLKDVGLKINPKEKIAEYFFIVSNPKNPSQVEMSKNAVSEEFLTSKLITHLLLLERLENENLAFFYKPSVNTINQFGDFDFTNPNSVPTKINDINVIELLIKYIDKEIIPKSELINLKANNYLTENQMEIKNSSFRTWTGIILASILSFSTLVYGICRDSSNGKKIKEHLSKLETSITSLKYEPKDYSKELQMLHEELQKLDENIVDAIKKSNQKK